MHGRSSPGSADPLARALFEAYLSERLGHVLRPWPASLEREIATLMRERGLTELELARSTRTPEIGKRILDAATVGYTEFFRHPEQLARIGRFLEQRTGIVRIHSAGCSTGEEPYSIAMLALSLGKRVQIVASDINATSLARARLGRYPKGPPGTTGTPWSAPTEARALIDFRACALRDAGTLGTFDLIVCRNVLIYFDTASVRSLVSMLAKQLLPGGRLVVAPVEALVVASDELMHEEPLGFFAVAGSATTPLAKPPAATVAEAREPDRDAMVEVAARALSAGDLDSAEERLRDALKGAPESAEAWFLLGEVLERRGEPSQSRAAFTCAAKYAGAHDALAHAAARRAGR